MSADSPPAAASAPFSSGNIAQLKPLGPCRIIACAVKLPATVIAHLPPKKAGSTALPESPVAAGSTDLSTWIMSCICLITF